MDHQYWLTLGGMGLALAFTLYVMWRERRFDTGKDWKSREQEEYHRRHHYNEQCPFCGSNDTQPVIPAFEPDYTECRSCLRRW